MELKDAIQKRRSVRGFDSKRDVSEDELNKILEAGRWAPSSGNSQCWNFYVVRDVGIKQQLATKAGHQQFIADAPLVIVVVADLQKSESSFGERGRETYALQDTAAAIENMLLTVTDLGLSSCWIGAFDEERAREILDLPVHMRTVAMLPIGLGDQNATRPPSRKALSEIVKYI